MAKAILSPGIITKSVAAMAQAIKWWKELVSSDRVTSFLAKVTLEIGPRNTRPLSLANQRL